MSNDIWEFGEGYHKVHTESIDVAKKLPKYVILTVLPNTLKMETSLLGTL